MMCPSFPSQNMVPRPRQNALQAAAGGREADAAAAAAARGWRHQHQDQNGRLKRRLIPQMVKTAQLSSSGPRFCWQKQNSRSRSRGPARAQPGRHCPPLGVLYYPRLICGLAEGRCRCWWGARATRALPEGPGSVQIL